MLQDDKEVRITKKAPGEVALVAEPKGRANSFVGTEEYLAPEIIQGHGHGAEVDWCAPGLPEACVGRAVWQAFLGAGGTVHLRLCTCCRWSFGILMYELLYGLTPFKGPKRDATFENILKKPLHFPPKPVTSPACQVSFLVCLVARSLLWAGEGDSPMRCCRT